MDKYNKRVWLNRESSPSTGSIVCFDGEHQWNKEREPRKESWVEIADCHEKVKIHRCYEDSTLDYLRKVELMRDTLNGYIDHLKKEV